MPSENSDEGTLQRRQLRYTRDIVGPHDPESQSNDWLRARDEQYDDNDVHYRQDCGDRCHQ